ncbi:MAG: FKBP-type peptidyl-prolyl cis-trans isomerase [Magnetococcus sp. YQC-5]
MKHLTLFASSVCVMGWLALPAAQAADAPAKPSAFKTPKERYSYAMGSRMGSQVQQVADSMDMKVFMIGLQDSLDKKPSQLTPDEITQASTDFKEVIQKEIEKKSQQAAEKNQKKGAEYLAANGAKKGVTTTASGLQYEVLTPGSGPKPTATDHVKVHYQGTLLDGTIFDSSIARKEPITFPLDRVIPGWTEGVQLMPTGSKYRFVIPAKLAYGSKGAPPSIEPESTLIFEVELLEIIKEKGQDKP